jgi:hypothetical protein
VPCLKLRAGTDAKRFCAGADEFVPQRIDVPIAAPFRLVIECSALPDDRWISALMRASVDAPT